MSSKELWAAQLPARTLPGFPPAGPTWDTSKVTTVRPGGVQVWELFHSAVPSSDNSGPKSHESGPDSKALLWAALCNFHFFHTYHGSVSLKGL